jgi:hypothetical protein
VLAFIESPLEARFSSAFRKNSRLGERAVLRQRLRFASDTFRAFLARRIGRFPQLGDFDLIAN